VNVALALALYAICWWLVLFAILPIGVRTQHDEGGAIPGTAESAPVRTHLLGKLAATTIVSGVIFALLYWLIAGDIVGLDDVPLLPRF
jgi:predicted secreted protein